MDGITLTTADNLTSTASASSQLNSRAFSVQGNASA
jgi:hypothetical protein